MTLKQGALSMTTERWTDSMLDSLAATTSDVVQSIGALAAISERNTDSIREIITRIDEMQSEVRGLQTENRRILDQLINRDNGNQP
jgi:hypothetical protein